ncbi:MAG: NUDIX domain-containing protein [Bacteroidota bacterium]
MINRLNIRVYGLLLNEQQEILVVDEQINDFKFTKFPGGGLELGEGIADCLQREFMEECELPIQVDKHFYTTDFFQVSAFRPTDQLISIYYWVNPQSKPFHINLNTITLNLNGKVEILQFKWIKLADLHENIFTFPIDKLVCSMLKKM